MVEQLRGYTPVATGSMRNKLRGNGLQLARGADDEVMARLWAEKAGWR